MNQSQETVTYSLETILMRIEGKIYSLQKDVTDLKIGQAVLTGKVEEIENRLNSWEENQKYVKTFFLSSNP
ncbi:MAG: polyhydroxyalkanoate biosynthesis repressor PhaR [Microcystis sp. LE19-338.1B]|jgi:cob(I)alamin adenosyltransferase|nr:polyhydroxyalkanoate biosynthesis repressor PhaR [Microcystis sp. LE19-338.1B]MCZ8360921.1 polyhydroxyalkanoate biosynthesis repressor PhaR [Microcystis sp. LE19-388.1G]